MRISDWSSDVCSSDLADGQCQRGSQWIFHEDVLARRAWRGGGCKRRCRQCGTRTAKPAMRAAHRFRNRKIRLGNAPASVAELLDQQCEDIIESSVYT